MGITTPTVKTSFFFFPTQSDLRAFHTGCHNYMSGCNRQLSTHVRQPANFNKQTKKKHTGFHNFSSCNKHTVPFGPLCLNDTNKWHIYALHKKNKQKKTETNFFHQVKIKRFLLVLFLTSQENSSSELLESPHSGIYISKVAFSSHIFDQSKVLLRWSIKKKL